MGIILFTLVIGGAFCALLLRFALPVVLPFLFAWALSHLIRPPSRWLAKRLSISAAPISVILLLAMLSALVWLIGASMERLLLELQQLLERLLSNEAALDAMGGGYDYFELLVSRLPFFRRIGAGEHLTALREGFNQMLSRLLDGVLESLSSAIPSVAAALFSALPSILLSVVITVIAGFYFCIDGDRITHSLIAAFPVGCQRSIAHWRLRLISFAKGYLRAYLLLFLLTLSELFLGLCILRVEYAFLLAILIALIDLLPVLGVGTVLIPWSVVSLFWHDYRLAVGLLILFGIVTLVRQIMEPRLLGKSLGLHPLCTLFASYAGWRFFGIVGMLLGPIVAAFLYKIFLLPSASQGNHF